MVEDRRNWEHHYTGDEQAASAAALQLQRPGPLLLERSAGEGSGATLLLNLRK